MDARTWSVELKMVQNYIPHFCNWIPLLGQVAIHNTQLYDTYLVTCQQAALTLLHVLSRIWGGRSSVLPTSHRVYLALGQMCQAVQWPDCCVHDVFAWQLCGRMVGLHSHGAPDGLLATFSENDHTYNWSLTNYVTLFYLYNVSRPKFVYHPFQWSFLYYVIIFCLTIS